MGTGEARSLPKNTATDRTLDPELSEKLSSACAKLDELNPSFKTGRVDERHQQMVKAWGRRGATMVEYLHEIGNVLVESHQISLDMGSDGGGRDMRPWIEEAYNTIDRLEFELDDDGTVHAKSAGHVVASCPMQDVDYDWVERAVVEWVVQSANRLS